MEKDERQKEGRKNTELKESKDEEEKSQGRTNEEREESGQR